MTELLEAYARKLSLLFERTGAGTGSTRPFELNQPLTVTMKTRTGQYRKHPLIGGERFRPSSAYLGKSGKLIIVFTPFDTLISSKYAFMEMHAELARSTLNGFSTEMDRWLSVDFDEQVAQYKAEAKAEENKAYIEAKVNQYPESFGSW